MHKRLNTYSKSYHVYIWKEWQTKKKHWQKYENKNINI